METPGANTPGVRRFRGGRGLATVAAMEKRAPFRSEAQRRLFAAKAARGEISRRTVQTWEAKTSTGRKLPARVKHGTSFLEEVARLAAQRTPDVLDLQNDSQAALRPAALPAGVPPRRTARPVPTLRIGGTIGTFLTDTPPR